MTISLTTGDPKTFTHVLNVIMNNDKGTEGKQKLEPCCNSLTICYQRHQQDTENNQQI